jgi:hypothetical protein
MPKADSLADADFLIVQPRPVRPRGSAAMHRSLQPNIGRRLKSQIGDFKSEI